MTSAPSPIDERERLAALLRYDVLDSPPERAYDDIVRLASQICDAPVAWIGFVAADRVWHKARLGMPFEEAPREVAFCSHTILHTEPLVVPDLTADERFADHPAVADGLRFYAGAPLVTADGHAIGTLCAMDTVARHLSDEQHEALAALSRQVMAHLELRRLLDLTREEAMTDALTGLGNRRRLAEDFAQIAVRGDSDAHLLLYDLDGFKRYNDSFGHNAGDALLARLAGKLAAALEPHGSVYRLGGDEFCALVRCAAGELDAMRAAANAALSERGEGFAIGASHGAVALHGDGASLTTALRIADERMYGQKAARSHGGSGQAHDVLVRVLDVCDGALHARAHAVAALAVQVGRLLGLDAEQRHVLADAARLHDVGTIAIPDAILQAQGQLSEADWAFLRAHTLLGERIMAAAPALARPAALVRSSHERWDGTGYPDGLAGADIPLGSRIIFACDAYDAMTSPRPYRVQVTRTEALAELRRCAGTQFDPDVVAALGDVLTAADGEPARLRRAA
jgi:diguanylate cyclase (GGDEF)-like protein